MDNLISAFIGASVGQVQLAVAAKMLRMNADAAQSVVKMIDASIPPTTISAGTRHETRLKAARLLGGYVAGGILTYDEAYAALEAAVARNTDDFARSMKTIVDGLAYGKQDAITLEDVNAILKNYPLTVSTTVTIGPRETVKAPV